MTKINKKCLMCENEVKKNSFAYCSSKCSNTHQYLKYIDAWKRGECDGMKADGSVSSYVRKYMLLTYGEKCSECGWNKRNPITNKVPIEIHHIDGNSLNNREDNLKLLCPNCHSLTPTFRSLNRNGTRLNRSKKPTRRIKNPDAIRISRVKLSKEDVIAIYFSKDTQSELSTKYNIDHNIIRRIWEKVRWQSITKDFLPFHHKRGNIKLSKSDIITIYNSKEFAKTVSEKFNISVYTVYDIRNKRRWRSITDEL